MEWFKKIFCKQEVVVYYMRVTFVKDQAPIYQAASTQGFYSNCSWATIKSLGTKYVEV